MMRIPFRRSLFRGYIIPVLCLALDPSGFVLAQTRPAQQSKTQPLHLQGITLNGLHSFLTESWVTVELTVTNPNTEGREGRVVVFYAGRPDAQYARDIWVPGRSTMSTWMLVGPAPEKELGVRSQESEDRSQGAVDGNQEPGVRGREAGVRNQESGVRGQEAGGKGRESGRRGPGPGGRSRGPAVRTPKLEESHSPALRPTRMELQALIYEHAGDKERLLLPKTEERVRSRLEAYQPREPVTGILLDIPASTQLGFFGRDIQEKAPETEDVVDLARAFRGARSLSEHVRLIQDEFLPPTADAFDGLDHFVLASHRLADDPCGQVALSRWLEQGGRLWAMLDRTDPDVVAGIMGGVPGFHVVDRTTLTRVQIEGSGPGATSRGSEEAGVREFERPVDFVRVELGPEFTVLHRVNGWPASFTRTIGQGKVLMTTLEARAWWHPRTDADPESPFDMIADVPVLMPAMEQLAQQLQPGAMPTFPRSSSGTKESDVFAPLVKGDIGYRVVSVGTASLIFVAFLLTLLILGVGLRKWGRLELLGWVGPVAALSTGGAFMALGEASRNSISPTVAVAQRVAVNPRSSELSVAGLLGFYMPNGGPATISTTRGGLLELDMSGLEGQTRRLVTTDIDAWHWENLTLPAGMRLGTFRSIARIDEPISCVARFGLRGLEGKFQAGRFRGLTDLLIQAPSRRVFSVRPGPDGQFAIGENDLLLPDQFVAGTVLSDHQQKRQAIYRRLLTESQALRPSDDSVLFGWTDPLEVPFDFETRLRSIGSALISVPLEMEHTAADTRVTVPRGFIAYRRIQEAGATKPNLEGQAAIDQRLRFQLPPSILPLHVESARLFAKVECPSRRFTVRALTKNGPVELRSEESPVNPQTIDIVREDSLNLDEQGGLHLEVAVSEPERVGDEQPPKWSIQTLELEVVGTTLKRN